MVDALGMKSPSEIAEAFKSGDAHPVDLGSSSCGESNAGADGSSSSDDAGAMPAEKSADELISEFDDIDKFNGSLASLFMRQDD